MNKYPGQLKFGYPNEALTDFGAPVERLKETRAQAPNVSLGINRVLCINHEKRPDRLHSLVQQCDKLGLWLERIPAIFLSPREFENSRGKFWKYTGGYELSRSEIGCFLSHIQAWKKIAREKDSDIFIVVEDDVEFTPQFSVVISNFLRQYSKKDNDLIRLGLDIYNELDIESAGPPNLYETGLATGTYAYLMHPSQARFFIKLIESLTPVYYPLDLIITGFDDQKFPIKKPYDQRVKGLRSLVLNCPETSTYHYNRWLETGKIKDNPLNKVRKGIVGEASSLTNEGTSSGPRSGDLNLDLNRDLNRGVVGLFLILLAAWLILLLRYLKSK